MAVGASLDVDWALSIEFGFGFRFGSTSRVTGEPKARHSHLKPLATFAVAVTVGGLLKLELM